jgi:hypothetical protein
MARVPKQVTVEDPKPYDPLDVTEVRLCFAQVFDEKSSSTNVERLTLDELRATRDAINEYLGET